jgi:predicted nucleic acid-binding protein
VTVVDASVLSEVLLGGPAAEAIEARLLGTGQTLHAPHLIDAEVAQVVRRFAMAGEIASEFGREALTDLANFPLRRYPHDFLLPRVWELRHNLSAYDAVYVALAEVLGAQLVTRDRRVATAPGHHARVELV